MEPFATVKELELRYRLLDESEKERAETLLSDASAILRSEFSRAGETIDESDEIQSANLVRVCCSMARRVLSSGPLDDVSSVNRMAGSYSEQRTFANPTGDMYITKNERRSLGLPLRKQRIACFNPPIFGDKS
jgi:hypothetical protein|nr:MAG TPA: hypothetical protein [Caudoviricetes sp.]